MLKKIRWIDSRWKTISDFQLYVLFNIDISEIKDRKTDELKLSDALKKKLNKSRHKSLFDILQMRISEVREIRAFGERSWLELADFLLAIKENKDIYDTVDDIIQDVIEVGEVEELYTDSADTTAYENEEVKSNNIDDVDPRIPDWSTYDNELNDLIREILDDALASEWFM